MKPKLNTWGGKGKEGRRKFQFHPMRSAGLGFGCFVVSNLMCFQPIELILGFFLFHNPPPPNCYFFSLAELTSFSAAWVMTAISPSTSRVGWMGGGGYN